MSLVEPSKLNVLVSYPYLNERLVAMIAERGDEIRLLVDSGAFTAKNIGMQVTLSGYCLMLERLPIKPWRYFSLDVIGDWQSSRANTIAMQRAGLKPVGIYHRGAPMDEIEFYYGTNDLMGMGGMVGRGVPAYLNHVMRKIGTRPVHWLGYSKGQFLKFYRPYSCDSSSFEMAGIYGNMHLFLPDGDRVYVRRTKLGQHLTPQALAAIRGLGVDPSMLHYADAWHGTASWARVVGALAMVMHMRQCWTKLQTMYFCAIANTGRLQLLLDAWDASASGQATEDLWKRQRASGNV